MRKHPILIAFIIAIAAHGILFGINFLSNGDSDNFRLVKAGLMPADYDAQEKTNHPEPEIQTETIEYDFDPPELPAVTVKSKPKVDISEYYQGEITVEVPVEAPKKKEAAFEPPSSDLRFTEIPTKKPASKKVVKTSATQPEPKISPEPPKKESPDEPVIKKTEIEGADSGHKKTELKAEFAHMETPVYPEIARRRGLEGTVKIKIRVLADGSVDNAEIQTSSGYDSLDKAALKAALKCKFKPLLIDGKPAIINQVIPFEFKLIEQK